MPKPTVVVWFSCGAASAVAAFLAVRDLSAAYEVRVVNTPVDEEDADNRRFLRDVETWIGQPIEIATNPDFPSQSATDVWETKRFMSSPFGAPCTLILKKGARYAYEDAFRAARGRAIDWHVLGFHAGEQDRHDKFVLLERPNVLPLLIGAGLTKPDCARIVLEAGIALPDIYRQGYPNANCKGCVKATSPTYWNHVRRADPDVFAARAKQSREIGARLARYRGERVFLDELPPDATGRPMETLSFECGLFCEEEPTLAAA